MFYVAVPNSVGVPKFKNSKLLKMCQKMLSSRRCPCPGNDSRFGDDFLQNCSFRSGRHCEIECAVSVRWPAFLQQRLKFWNPTYFGWCCGYCCGRCCGCQLLFGVKSITVFTVPPPFGFYERAGVTILPVLSQNNMAATMTLRRFLIWTSECSMLALKLSMRKMATPFGVKPMTVISVMWLHHMALSSLTPMDVWWLPNLHQTIAFLFVYSYVEFLADDVPISCW
jgi:hypothetical protein